MKKALTAVLVLLMAVPAFALPYCTTGCGMSETAGAACCCDKALPSDGSVSLQAPPCCPPALVMLHGADKPVALPTPVSEISVEESGLIVVADLASAWVAQQPAALPECLDFGDARPPSLPLFLSNSVLLI